jgi:ubiquinone/menaquinone biosynthesis C-methylase UbiE
MGDSTSTNTFLPRQATEPTWERWLELAGDGGEQVGLVSLKEIPSIPAGSIIHDNGCGTGATSYAIMASVPPEISSSFEITATDIMEKALDVYRARSAASSWPSEVLLMDADELSFPDETFTHSIASAMIFNGPRNNGIDAVKEMRRTLKPGGKLVINSFAFASKDEPLLAAARATRPEGTPLPVHGLGQWADPNFLVSIVEAGGFAKESMTVQQREMFANIGDFDRHTELTWSYRGRAKDIGWTKEDEERWDEAVEIFRTELRKSEGFKMFDDGTAVLRSIINVVTATK